MLRVKSDNITGYPQKDRINDGVVGGVEVRCYEIVAEII